MKDTASKDIILRMLGGVVLGIILGAILAAWRPGEIAGIDLVGVLDVIGTLFLNALSIIVFPLIIAMLVVGITNLADYRKLGAVTYKTLGFFIATSGVAVVIGLLLAIIIGPGRGEVIAAAPLSGDLAPQRIQSIGEFLKTLIPTNLISAASGGSYLGLFVFVVVFAAILTTMSNRARTVVSFFRAVHEALLRIVGLIVWLAPIGLIGLVGAIVARNGSSLMELFGGLGTLVVVVIIGLLIHGAVVLPFLLRTYALRAPLEFFRNLTPALLTAFGTRSSAATLPITYRNVTDDNDVDSRAGSYVLPLAASLNMNGSALFLAAGSVYIAQASGVPLSIFGYVALAVGSLLVSFALAGVPSAALFGLVAVGAIAGFPQQAQAALVALVLIDWLLDGFRTAVNVAGDAVGAAVIGEVFEFKTVGRKGARAAEVRTAREPRPRQDRGRGRGRDRDRDTRKRPDRAGPDKRGRRDRRDDKRGQKQDRRGDSERRQQRQEQRQPQPQERRSHDDRRSQADERDKRPRPQPPKEERKPKPPEPPKPQPEQKSQEPPKPKEPTRESREADKQRRPKPDDTVMSQETIEEELKRVREQLSSDSDTEPTKPEEVETDSKRAAELPEEEPVRSDHTAEAAQEETAREESRESQRQRKSEEAPPPEADKKEESEEKKVSYGRGRGRRAASPKTKQTSGDVPGPVDEDGKDEKEPRPEDSYDKESMSFGRGKRKK